MYNFKVIIIAGEPASGKTTLVCKVFEPSKMAYQFKFGKLRGHSDGEVFVGGVYDGTLFQGTDRLSMSVQPDVVAFIKHKQAQQSTTNHNGAQQSTNPTTLVMEGDRVANQKFLFACEELGVDLHIVFLTTPEETLATRHTARGDKQSARWLASRKTKIKNLLSAANAMQNLKVHLMPNHTEALLETNAASLLAILKT